MKMDERELGSDGEDVSYVSGASSVEEVANEEELEFDMWPGQFSLAAAVPASRHAPWFSNTELNARTVTFDSYLAGNLKNGTTLISNDLPTPPPRMTRSLQHMPSFMTETMEEGIQSVVDDILNEMDAYVDASYEDAVEILARNRVNSMSNWAARSGPCKRLGCWITSHVGCLFRDQYLLAHFLFNMATFSKKHKLT